MLRLLKVIRKSEFVFLGKEIRGSNTGPLKIFMRKLSVLGYLAALTGACVSAGDLKLDNPQKKVRKVKRNKNKRTITTATKNKQYINQVMSTISGVGEEIFFEPYSGYYFKSSREEIDDALYQCYELMWTDGFARLNDFYNILGLGELDIGTRLGWEMPIPDIRTVPGRDESVLLFSIPPKVIDINAKTGYNGVIEACGEKDYIHSFGETKDFLEPITGTLFQASEVEIANAMIAVQEQMSNWTFATLEDFFNELDLTNAIYDSEKASFMGWEMPTIPEPKDMKNGAKLLQLPEIRPLLKDMHTWEF